MNQDFKKCLDRGTIYPDPTAKSLAEKEFAVALRGLAAAQKMFNDEMPKYCTITAYYAMFHAARALLFSQGYKERGHRCLIHAIEALFVEKKLLEMQYIRNLLNAMSLREDADYADEYSKQGAQDSLITAKEFIQKAQELLNKGV